MYLINKKIFLQIIKDLNLKNLQFHSLDSYIVS